MNVELVAQMFKNYQSNVLFHLEGVCLFLYLSSMSVLRMNLIAIATENLKEPS